MRTPGAKRSSAGSTSALSIRSNRARTTAVGDLLIGASVLRPRQGNETFTSASPRRHSPRDRAAHTLGMEVTGRLLFMGAVTCYLLGRIFTGEVTPLETVVYGVTAAFGLQFLVASWRGLWPRA